MVVGLDKFRETFREYTDRYVLIGGTACSLEMEEAGLSYRSTKDLDIVLCIEALTDDFISGIWDFILMGQYEIRQKGESPRCFYRFAKPKENGFPYMLELFSRKPDGIVFKGEGTITPVPAGKEASSLSAILLNDDYYTFLMQGKHTVGNLSILKSQYLIPLKVKAFLDLSERRASGEDVDSKDIRKHKNDVFRLAQLLSGETRLILPETLIYDLKGFLLQMVDDPIKVSDFIPGSINKEQLLYAIKANYENID